MHRGDQASHPSRPETAANRFGGLGERTLKERGRVAENRSGAKKPNNGQPKKEPGVVHLMFWFEPGIKSLVFFFSLPGWQTGEGGVQSKLYGEHT